MLDLKSIYNLQKWPAFLYIVSSYFLNIFERSPRVAFLKIFKVSRN